MIKETTKRERIMKLTLIILLMVCAFFLGAYSHEGDIQSSCKEKGEATKSAWRGDLKCSPLNKGT